MKKVLLILGTDDRFVSVATDAMRSIDPAAEIRRVDTVEEAQNAPPEDGIQLLAIAGPTAEVALKAAGSTDKRRLPSQAVVICADGGDFADAAVVSPADWNVAVVSQVFRLSLARHRLRRENAQLRGDLLSIGTRLVHDMRTPLGGIQMAAEALAEQLAQAKVGDAVIVRPIIDSGDEALRILRKLALISASFGTPKELVRTNIGDAVLYAAESLEGQVRRSRAVVVRHPSWPDVMADPLALETIWSMLLENALVHGGIGRRVEMGWQPAEGGLKFFVRDDGPGVPQGKLGLLFHPFHRLHEANAARGLGLPIVERLVQLQGGRCGYEQNGRAGASFFFILPRLKEPESKPAV